MKRKNIAFGVAMALKESPMHNWPWLTCLLESIHLNCTRLISEPKVHCVYKLYANLSKCMARCFSFNIQFCLLSFFIAFIDGWNLVNGYGICVLARLGGFVFFASTFLRAIYLAKFIKMWLTFTASIQKWKKIYFSLMVNINYGLFKIKMQINFVQKWK